LGGGEPLAVLGTPGGDTIPSTLLQLVRHLVDHGMALDEAIDAPRFHHGFVPDRARYEAGVRPPSKLLAQLEKLGHDVSPRTAAIGDAKCIVLGDEQSFAYSDTREGGLALAAAAH
jgi:gamma-glutamyltranspeptidase/glutathione hydrolase